MKESQFIAFSDSVGAKLFFMIGTLALIFAPAAVAMSFGASEVVVLPSVLFSVFGLGLVVVARSTGVAHQEIEKGPPVAEVTSNDSVASADDESPFTETEMIKIGLEMRDLRRRVSVLEGSPAKRITDKPVARIINKSSRKITNKPAPIISNMPPRKRQDSTQSASKKQPPKPNERWAG